MSNTAEAIRPPSLIEFSRHETQAPAQPHRWTARGQNFAVTYLEASAACAPQEFASGDELMLLNIGGPLEVEGGRQSLTAPSRSICILPPGTWRLTPAAGSRCTIIQSLRGDKDAPGSVNDAAYAAPDPRIAPVGTPYQRLGDGSKAQVLLIDEVKAPADKPRLKMLQTSTLSINWVEYEGPRNRTQLSPHSHASFEQGSLGLEGDFVHHLRSPWGENADLWQEDRHAQLASPSLMVVPVGLVHTSEGVGPGHHLLIDVFSPPRADFIARGWVANAGDYAAPQAAA